MSSSYRGFDGLFSNQPRVECNRGFRTYLIFSAPPTGRVNDVINTDCWAQNDSTHGRVFVTFKRRFLTSSTRNQVNTCSLSLSVSLCLCLSVSLCYRSVCLSVCLSVSLSCLNLCLSVCLSLLSTLSVSPCCFPTSLFSPPPPPPLSIPIDGARDASSVGLLSTFSGPRHRLLNNTVAIHHE